MNSKRIVYLDIIRIIAIFTVMIIHVTTSLYETVPINGYEWQVFNVYESISRFCVPIFIMISGVFFLDPIKDIKLERLFKHNILRIVTAFLFWSFIYACYNAAESILVRHSTVNSSLLSAFANDFLYGHYHMWFLFVIVGLYVIVPLLRKITEDKKVTEYFLLLSFTFCYLKYFLKAVPHLGNVLVTLYEKIDVSFVMGYSGFFVLGYYLHTYELTKKEKNILYALGAGSVLFTIVGTAVLSSRCGYATQELYAYLLPTTCFESAAIFVWFKDHVSENTFKENTLKRLLKLSELTFGMYLLHDFYNILFQHIGFTAIVFQPIVSVPIISIIVFLCSWVTAYLISKIPIVSKYIM